MSDRSGESMSLATLAMPRVRMALKRKEMTALVPAPEKNPAFSLAKVTASERLPCSCRDSVSVTPSFLHRVFHKVLRYNFVDVINIYISLLTLIYILKLCFNGMRLSCDSKLLL